LIVGGTPDDPTLECFPSGLKFKLDANGQISAEPAEELLAADIREEGDGKTLALAKVIAGVLGLSPDEVFRRAERERRAAMLRRRRVQAIVGVLALLLVAGGVGWLNQGYLKERHFWLTVMRPSVLTTDKEQALQPKDEFKECDNGCPLMVVIPAGTFMMGSKEAAGQNGEHPQHEVAIARAFGVGKFEVTFAEWDVCEAAGGCIELAGTRFGRGEVPASGVTWDEAQQYVSWLSKLTGKTYRLLTEAEWEYAARAGTTTLYSFGDDEAMLGDYAWYADNSERVGTYTQPVGKKPANAFGLYDMHGNVREWVEDASHRNYDGAPSDGSEWVVGANESVRMLRGGSWHDPPDELRSAYRTSYSSSSSRFYWNGLRVARTLGVDSVVTPSMSLKGSLQLIAQKLTLWFHTPPPSQGLAGIYRVSGTDPGGNHYSGMLALSEEGDRFALVRWIGKDSFHGFGHLAGKTLVVNWGDEHSVIYTLDANNSLHGEWAQGPASETAELVGQAAARSLSPEGSYRVEGRYPDGTPYVGTVTINSQPRGYRVRWRIGNSSYYGDGVFKDNILTVEWGSTTPAVYALSANGGLKGLWDAGEGEETLTPDQ
jgi:formylglycine-generating enzyme required for sulfatase activity